MTTNTFDLTAIILTFNEARHIERCISRLKPFCREVIVVDSFSTDSTVELAQALGATVLQNAWVNHAHQFNWALDHAVISTGWVIRVDADEYLESALDSLTALENAASEISGFYLNRKYFFLGQWIRHGSMYPVKTLRIFRFGKGRVEQRWMDEHIVLDSGQAENLPLELVDDNLNPVSWWIQKHNGYATLEMLEALNLKYGFMHRDERLQQAGAKLSSAGVKRFIKEHIYSRLPLFLRPFLYFLFRYFIRLGFLDGRKGLAFHFMQGFWYRALVDLKVLEAEDWITEVSQRDADAIRNLLAGKTGLKL